MEYGTKMSRIGRFSRLAGRPLGRMTSFGKNFPPMEDEVIHTYRAHFLKGMDSDLTITNIPDDMFGNILNLRPYRGALLPRHGIWTTATKPNSNRVIGYAAFTRFSGVTQEFRFTKNSVHELESGSWVALTGPALGGGDRDRFQTIFVEDRIFFNNNGLNVLMEIDASANTYAAAGNARKYKYYTLANNRIVGANLVDGSPNPIEIATSGDRNYDEWDPTVDITAYRNSLIDPESTTIDEITGLVNLDDNVVVFRSRSIWLGIPQPIFSVPFAFKRIVSGIGCNVPYSIQKVGNAIVWYDNIANDVFYLTLEGANATIRSVGKQIRNNFDIGVPEWSYVFSNYDPTNNLYEIGRESVGDINTNIYTLNLDDFNWSQALYRQICLLTNKIVPVISVTIDSLSGTIDALVGTIDNLSQTKLANKKVFGYNDGNISEENPQATIDLYISTTHSIAYNFSSKGFVLSGNRRQRVRELRIYYRGGANSVVLFANRDDKGTTVVKSKNFPIVVQGPNNVGVVKFPLDMEGRLFRFAIQWFDSNMRILGYEVDAIDVGPL